MTLKDRLLRHFAATQHCAQHLIFRNSFCCTGLVLKKTVGRAPPMRVLELADVIAMLRSEVKRAGGQVAWAQKASVDRAIVSKVLNGHRPPNKAITEALKLRMVFVSEPEPSLNSSMPRFGDRTRKAKR
jgi:hypothetical protein